MIPRRRRRCFSFAGATDADNQSSKCRKIYDELNVHFDDKWNVFDFCIVGCVISIGALRLPHIITEDALYAKLHGEGAHAGNFGEFSRTLASFAKELSARSPRNRDSPATHGISWSLSDGLTWDGDQSFWFISGLCVLSWSRAMYLLTIHPTIGARSVHFADALSSSLWKHRPKLEGGAAE